MENSINDIPNEQIILPSEPVVMKTKRGVGRPRKPESRKVFEEKGKYDNHTLDPDYFKKYYIEKIQGNKKPCPKCGTGMFVSVSMAKHMKSKKCQAISEIIDLKNKLNS